MPGRSPLNQEQQRLVHETLPLVNRVARQLARRYPRVGVDELVAAGREALVDAARTFDASRGVPFEAFAYVRVRGEVLDHGAREAILTSARVRRALNIGSQAFDATNDEGSDPLNDTLEDARARANSWISDAATSLVAAYLMGQGVAPRDPEATLAAAREDQLAREVLAALPADDAALAREHYIDGETLGAIAERRGVAERTVQRHHRRVLDVLRQALIQRGVTATPPR